MVKKIIIKSNVLKDKYIKISDRKIINLFKIKPQKNFLLSKKKYIFDETNDSVLPAYHHGFQFYIVSDSVFYGPAKIPSYNMNSALESGLFYYNESEKKPNLNIMVGKIVKSKTSDTFLVEASNGYGVELANLLDNVSSESHFSFVDIGLTADKKYWAFDSPLISTIYSEINAGEKK